MVVSAEEYKHKVYGVIRSPEHLTSISCEKHMAAAASPEPKGTLTPPGSSPICDPRPDSAHGSTPPSPEAPPTPDSAHMATEPTNHSAAVLQLANERAEDHLSGARKRKAAKVHKVETECGSEGEGEGSFVCPVCQDVHNSQHEFTQHIRKHNHVLEADNGTKVYCCGICRKQLSSNSSLDRHMLVHSGERPFSCHICGTHFTTNGNMHRHIRGHYRNGGGGGGGGAGSPTSDTGDSDLGSDDSPTSPYKRPHDEEEEEVVVPAKMVRMDESEELACPACGVEQGNQHALEHHVEQYHPEYQVSCTSCQVAFKNYRALHLHNSMVHPAAASPPQLQLTQTDFSTSKFPLIAKEVCEASNRQQEAGIEVVAGHRCHLRPATVSSADAWLMHMREHAAATAPPIRCVNCDLTFPTFGQLTRHHQRHVCEEPQPRKESFLAVLDLLSKQTRVPSVPVMDPSILAGGLKPLLGPPPPGHLSPAPADSAKASPEHPTTGTTTAPPTATTVSPLVTSAGLVSHDEQFARGYRDMKQNGQYPCRLCKEVYANLRKLKSHNLVHMLAPPYRCNLCTFFSNDKNTLKEHMKNHKGDTPYECTLCNLAFTTKANCERHIKNIHGRQSRDEIKVCMNFIPTEDSGGGEHTLDTVCHICHIDCKARSVLHDHMRSSHPEGLTKPFLCRLCGCAFTSENDVMRHVIQQHSEAASGPTLESLVVARGDEDHTDLTPVETLLNFSKLPMSMPLTAPHPPPPSVDLPLPFHHKPVIVPPMVPSRPLTPCLPPFPDTDDAPLDLSMKKEDGGDEDEEEVDVEANEVKTEQEEPEDLSKPRRESEEEGEDREGRDCRSAEPLVDSPANVLKIPRPSYPLYHHHLSLCGTFPPQYSPLMMGPYGVRPQFDTALLEEYQEKIKRGLQFTSGGGLLGGAAPFLPTASPSFPLSTLALAAARRHHLQIPRPDLRAADPKMEEPPRPEAQASPAVSKPGEDDVMHFTMRNSVLMKKPKQRRYRTDRPWRCKFCDKGFTLRSNMERHVKQQHPDEWQQRPRGATATSRADQKSPAPPTTTHTTISDAVREQLITKIEKEAAEEREEPRREEEDTKLVIDDEPEKEEEEEEEQEQEQDEEEEEEEEEEEREDEDEGSEDQAREEGGTDLASVHKLLSTASQSFSFFGSEGEEDTAEDDEDDSSSSTPMTEEGRRSAYSSAPQKQMCPFCSRKFPWSSSLVRHIRTHTGQKPYLCPVCHFPFTTKSNCDRHLLRKHPDSPHTLGGDRPYCCTKCPGAAFTNLESLRKHEMFKHEKASDTAIPRDDTRPFRCHVCEAPLATREAALLHLNQAHPDHALAATNTDPATPDNNNDPPSPDPDSTTTEKVSCMFCLQRYWSLAELKQHISEHHMAPPSPSPVPPSPSPVPPSPSPVPPSPTTSEDEVKDAPLAPARRPEGGEVRREESEGNDLISNMLGTQSAVVDRLLTSSADDAAKLLGVR